MMTEAEKQAINAKQKEKADRAFQDWLREPLVVLAISLIPEGEHREALKFLLRSSFDCGVTNGNMFAMESILESLDKRLKS